MSDTFQKATQGLVFTVAAGGWLRRSLRRLASRHQEAAVQAERTEQAQRKEWAATVYESSNSTWRALLDALAAHPGVWLPWPVLVALVGEPSMRIAGSVSAGERVCRHLSLPYERRVWKGRTEIRMAEDLAELFRSVARERSSSAE